MNTSEFSKKYWTELKPFVRDIISEAPLYSNKHEYVRDCWQKSKIEIEKYELNEVEFRGIYARLRNQIENEILRK